jgi:hypothetical protein
MSEQQRHAAVAILRDAEAKIVRLKERLQDLALFFTRARR